MPPVAQPASSAAAPALTVQAVVWPWRAPAVAPGPRRSLAALLRAALPLLVAGALWRADRPLAAGLVAGVGSAVLLLALLLPAAHARLEHALQRLGYGVGTLVTWLLLVPVWWLCFVPGRLAFALAGKDPLQRALRRDASTYWLPKPPHARPNHWTRQF